MAARKRRNKGQSRFNTKPEILFKDWLEIHNIKYDQQVPTEFGNIDFYLPETPKTYINCPYTEYYIKSNSSHFDKKRARIEYLLEF